MCEFLSDGIGFLTFWGGRGAGLLKNEHKMQSALCMHVLILLQAEIGGNYFRQFPFILTAL